MKRVSLRALAALLALVCLLLLGACGVTAAPGGIGGGVPAPSASHVPGASTAHPAPTRTPGSVGIGAAATGCAASASSSGIIPSASVMLPDNTNASAVAVKVGQTVGVDLKASFRWVMHRDDPAQALAPQPPQGALDAANATCDWRFLAEQPGAVTLSFTGIFQCPPHTMCPALALARTYTLDVQA